MQGACKKKSLLSLLRGREMLRHFFVLNMSWPIPASAQFNNPVCLQGRVVPRGGSPFSISEMLVGDFSEMLAGVQQFSATNFRSTIHSHKLLSVKTERSDGESELIHKRCAHLCSPLPGERSGYFECRSQMYANEGDG